MKIISYLFLLLFIIGISFTAWHFRKELPSMFDQVTAPYESLLTKKEITPQIKSPENWKKVKIAKYNLSLLVPPDWNQVSENSISQYILPLSPIPQAIYNLIQINSNKGILIDGYYNQDLFNKLYKLPPGQPDTLDLRSNVTVTVISHGKTLSGHRFVIFKSETISQSTLKVIETKGFIIKNDTLIIFNLLYFNQQGLDTLEKILTYSTVN